MLLYEKESPLPLNLRDVRVKARIVMGKKKPIILKVLDEGCLMASWSLSFLLELITTLNCLQVLPQRRQGKKLECLQELTAFFSCMAVFPCCYLSIVVLFLPSVTWMCSAAGISMIHLVLSCYGTQRNRFDIDTYCQREKAILEKCVEDTVSGIRGLLGMINISI